MSKFKTRKKYRLTFINENTFNAVWTVKLSRLKVWGLSVFTVAAIAALILLLAVATPLSALLPGYLKPQQREEHINNTLRVDSLSEVLAVNTAFLQNIADILGDNVEPDSAATDVPMPEITDTLIQASEAERSFVEKWDARERYTLSVLTPLAADAVTFHQPVTGAKADTLLTNGAVKSLILIPPRGAAVTSVAPGSVISVNFDAASGYSVIVQHSNNLLSVTSGIDNIAVEPGKRLQSGEALGRSDGRKLSLTIWLDGTSLDPRTLIR